MSSEASKPTIRPNIIGWVGLALTLLAVATVQWFGSWGYLLAAPALALLLVGTFGMQREVERRSASVSFVPTEHKTNGAAPAMSPERRDALSAKDSPPGTDSRNQPGRIGSPE